LRTSPMLLIAFLEVSIALLLALLFFMLIRRHMASGRSLKEVVRSLFRVARRPLQGIALAAAFVLALYFITPNESVSPSSIAVFLLFYGALAILPPWLPTLRLTAIATLAFYLACAFAFARLLPMGSEGPDVMAVSLLLLFFWLLFFVSFGIRLAFRAFSSLSKLGGFKSQAQHVGQ
jgi:hypothetical protein